ncbi:MAG: rhodanese-like domain-containing protein [Bacilli bacterium]|nr:rhodanese-like domain-containing protein [Bacilli bacterium]
MNIDINSILKMNSSNIIDIRDRNSYVMGHIPQAINIEEYDLLFNTNKYLNKNSIYYIYCDLGNRSGQLAMKLRKDGYNVINIEGGYHNYLLRK